MLLFVTWFLDVPWDFLLISSSGLLKDSGNAFKDFFTRFISFSLARKSLIEGLFPLNLGAPGPNFIGNFSISKKILLIDKNYTRSKILKDKIIIIESADPGYDWIFSKKIAGLITMFGGANSHMAIRTSELNLPAAIGVGKKKFLQMQQSNYVKLDPINKILERIE